MEASQIKEYLAAIYVDDGRSLQRKLHLGERFNEKKRIIEYEKKNEIEDKINGEKKRKPDKKRNSKNDEFY